MIDAREKAPGQASANMYLDEQGNVDRNKAINGPLAAGINHDLFVGFSFILLNNTASCH